MFYIYPVRQILFLVSSWSWWWRDTSPHRLVCPVVRSKYYFIIEQEIRRNWPYILSFSRVIQSECTRSSWRICHCTQPETALEISCCLFYYNIGLWAGPMIKISRTKWKINQTFKLVRDFVKVSQNYPVNRNNAAFYFIGNRYKSEMI